MPYKHRFYAPLSLYSFSIKTPYSKIYLINRFLYSPIFTHFPNILRHLIKKPFIFNAFQFIQLCIVIRIFISIFIIFQIVSKLYHKTYNITFKSLLNQFLYFLNLSKLTKVPFLNLLNLIFTFFTF